MKNGVFAWTVVLAITLIPLAAAAENIPDAEFDSEDHVMPVASDSSSSATDDDVYVGADPYNFNDMRGSDDFYGAADVSQDEQERK